MKTFLYFAIVVSLLVNCKHNNKKTSSCISNVYIELPDAPGPVSVLFEIELYDDNLNLAFKNSEWGDISVTAHDILFYKIYEKKTIPFRIGEKNGKWLVSMPTVYFFINKSSDMKNEQNFESYLDSIAQYSSPTLQFFFKNKKLAINSVILKKC